MLKMEYEYSNRGRSYAKSEHMHKHTLTTRTRVHTHVEWSPHAGASSAAVVAVAITSENHLPDCLSSLIPDWKRYFVICARTNNNNNRIKASIRILRMCGKDADKENENLNRLKLRWFFFISTFLLIVLHFVLRSRHIDSSRRIFPMLSLIRR